jgi:hypothetical protein
MRKNVNTCDFGDILTVAEDMGYDWNTIHDILRDNGCDTSYGARTIYKGEINLITEDKDARKVLKKFFAVNKIDEVTILPKSC